MNRQLRILMTGLLLFGLAGCDYLPSWVPGAKLEEAAAKETAKTPQQKPSDDELPIEQQILKLQQEIQAVEGEKQKLEDRRNAIQDEKETISELLQEQEADLQLKEREIKRLESTAPRAVKAQ